MNIYRYTLSYVLNNASPSRGNSVEIVLPLPTSEKGSNPRGKILLRLFFIKRYNC